MRQLYKAISFSLITIALSLAVAAQTKRPLTFDDLMAVKRLADAQIAPDGNRVAYVVSEIGRASCRERV